MNKPVVGVHELNKASKQILKSNKKQFGVVDSSNTIIINTEVSQFRAVVEQLTGRESRHESCMQSRIDFLFDRLLGEVNRLFTYPDWLPKERCQIYFYCQQLSYLSKELFRGSLNTCHVGYLSELLTDPTLNILVTRILVHKNLRTRSVDDLLKCDQPPDLTPVGDRLAFEVSVTFKGPWMQDFSKPAKDFASIFHFDKSKFREYEEEVFIGFQEEANILLQQLACITKKQLQVISIVGMAGNGKTTLARRLYNDPYVVSYFYVRAWVTCSQVYHKRDSLLSILKSIVEITDDEVCSMNDNMLAHALYRALKGKRYLIVIDDIWSNEAWDDLKRSFPNDNIGSRIMLTTRLNDVALHAQPDGNPLCLRFLTEEESFDLFRRKAFITEYFFDDLRLIGKSIARKCRGLPLTVVVIAGLLKHKLEIDWWVHVKESVSAYITTDENQYMDTLALSYNHLPQHLRPCFLSFGAFPEDHDIPVHKLIWFWIAEGFITPDVTKKSLEDVAEEYLMDLVSRSLIIAGKIGTNGAIKTCRIHDLLRNLCFKKAEEENFLPNIYNYNRYSRSLTNPLTGSQLLLSPNVLTVPSKCSSYSSGFFQSFFKDLSIGMETSKLIRVLDISSLELSVIPNELLQLVYLRYLEIRLRSSNLPETISQLTELRTLIVSSKMNIVVPETTWKMINLRHLCIKTGENLVNFCNEETSFLENLQTMSLVSPTRLSPHILARTPNLRKLGLCGPLTTKSGELKLPDLGLLMHLRMLKLLNTNALCKAGKLSHSIMFPETLKSLTVSNTYLDWKEAWVFEMIPNLEVLKLKFHAFVGKYWETSSQAFTHLKILKLDELDIENWTSFRNHFPVLQRLQVLRCPYLMEIPEDLGNICTLEWIELSGCSEAATNSAREIQKEQENNGNDWLKILLSPGLTPGKIYSQKHREALPQWSEQVQVPLGTGAEGPLADGYSWRKYGQKDILGATFPRAYYRCTYRHSQGCLATKQVQKTDEDSSLLQVTYKGRHTCKQGSESTAGLVLFGKEEKRQKKGSYEAKQEERIQEQKVEKIISFGTSLKTEQLGRSMEVERLPSFSFPCTIVESVCKKDHLFSEDTIIASSYSSYITPETSECSYLSLSPYHMDNFGIAQNLQSSESDLTEILSAPNSVTNSPIGEFDISLDPVEFDPNFPLDILEFFK